jgi:hypothetical protein
MTLLCKAMFYCPKYLLYIFISVVVVLCCVVLCCVVLCCVVLCCVALCCVVFHCILLYFICDFILFYYVLFHQDSIAAQISVSLLRHTDIIPCDKGFYEAGMAAKVKPGVGSSEVVVVRYCSELQFSSSQ